MSSIEIAFVKAGEHVCSKIPIEIPPELTVQESVKPPPNCGMFKILTAKDGDRRVIWNRFMLNEIRAAKKMFLELVNKGLVPHKVQTSGKPTSEIMKEFDPNAEEIVFLPVAAVMGG